MTTSNRSSYPITTKHVELARGIARSVGRQRVFGVSMEELEGAALLGLAEAAQRYDATLCPSFDSYAVARVRGAVLDELRRLDTRPRRVRQSHCKTKAVRDRLRTQSGQDPTADELAAEMGESRDKVQADLAATGLYFVPLKEDCHARETDDMVAAIDSRREQARLHDAMATLDERSSEIVRQFFFAGAKLRDIGESMGVTESRVCQLKARALRSIGEALRLAA